MTLATGARLGPYEITAKLGEGGMGEVYRATDSKLKREVAIKVLPAAFTQDKERLARFEREAQLLAQLNHPNIAQIYGLETSGESHALVMELVEGPTLADRLAQGALPLDGALSIAKQIAEALEEAHEKGIIHRDLKPQNIKASIEGKTKVLDFGLAKAMDPAAGSAASAGEDLLRSPTMMQSPTLTAAHGTQLGVILGTAAYMAPEQATGSAVDRRTDVWAFGVVLFEMLTGRRLFEGETVSHVLAGVLKDEPDFSALPEATPERIRNLIRRCLRKKPRERLQAIGDARVVLEEVLADPRGDARRGPAQGAAPGAAARSTKLAWAAAAAGLAAAALFAALWLGPRDGAAAARSYELALVAPAGISFTDSFALSPDGRRILFEGYRAATGERDLWLRDLDRGEAQKLAGGERGEMPFWSPDGGQVAFFVAGKLKRLDLRGGPAQTIADAPTPRGGAWGPDGRIVFSPSFRTGLSIVPANGGPARPLTTLDESRHEKSHRFPRFLPGGERILFLAQTAEGGARDDESTIEALDLASGRRTRLLPANSSLLFGLGQLLFWREGALLAQRFDPVRLALSGDPVALASPVAFTQNEQALASISEEGTLVYRAGDRGSYASLVLRDRTGLGVKPIVERELFAPDLRISPDGQKLAYAFNSPGQGSVDLWIYDLERDTASRLTFEDGNEDRPVWSPDGRFVYYTTDRSNDGAIFRRAADGGGGAEEIGTTQQGIWTLDASHDGRWLVIGAVGSDTNQDILRFDLTTKAMTPLVATPFNDQWPALSPDDRLLAYASEQSGRWEVYVQSLGGESGRWQISNGGGGEPRWRADGRELYFYTPPDRLSVVEVTPGAVPRFSAPRELFRQEPFESYDVTPDGQRLVALRSADSDSNRPLTLVTSWTERLPKR
jgi:Tol biopolymer transport system component